MDNVVEEYIKHTEKFLYSYFRILLQDTYNKKLVQPFINKYIDVRFYNNTLYRSEKNFLIRMNKELSLIANEMIKQNEDRVEVIKNAFALFSYVLYIDDCMVCSNKKDVSKYLLEDDNIKLEYTVDTKRNIKTLIDEYVDKNNEFNKLFDYKEFEIAFDRIKRNLQLAYIKQNVNISKLYSDYAIEKAFNSGVVEENKYLLLYYYLSYQILKNAINLEFNKNYVVLFPISLFDKNRKSNTFLRVLDNDLIKERLHIKYTYREYLENREAINNLISQGFSIALELDEYFDNDFNSLVLFSYVFISEKYDYYDYFEDSPNKIKTNIVKI